MAMSGFRMCITIAALAVAPVAFAQSTQAMHDAQRSSLDATLAAAPEKTPDEQQIDALRKEVDSLRSALNAQQEREDRRQDLLGDPNNHPLWP
jgi:uncharacterized membrane protein